MLVSEPTSYLLRFDSTAQSAQGFMIEDLTGGLSSGAMENVYVRVDMAGSPLEFPGEDEAVWTTKALLMSDVGPKMTIKIVESLREDILAGKRKSGAQIKEAFKKSVLDLLTTKASKTELILGFSQA